MMSNMKKFQIVVDSVWKVVKSPRTAAILRLGAAVFGVLHAIQDLKEVSSNKKVD